MTRAGREPRGIEGRLQPDAHSPWGRAGSGGGWRNAARGTWVRVSRQVNRRAAARRPVRYTLSWRTNPGRIGKPAASARSSRRVNRTLDRRSNTAPAPVRQPRPSAGCPSSSRAARCRGRRRRRADRPPRSVPRWGRRARPCTVRGPLSSRKRNRTVGRCRNDNIGDAVGVRRETVPKSGVQPVIRPDAADHRRRNWGRPDHRRCRDSRGRWRGRSGGAPEATPRTAFVLAPTGPTSAAVTAQARPPIRATRGKSATHPRSMDHPPHPGPPPTPRSAVSRLTPDQLGIECPG